MKPSVADIIMAVAVVLFLVWIANWDPFGSKARLRTQAAGAQAQAKVSDATAQATDAAAVKTEQIRAKTDVVIRTIKAAPGANDPVPAGVLAGWVSGLSDDADQPPH